MIYIDKAISFSLWGSNRKYTVGALENAYLAQYIYPNWVCVFFCDFNTVPESCINELKKYKNTQIIPIEQNLNWSGMFYRFLAAEFSNVSIFRDCDSRLSERELYAVNDWLKSGKSFHIMRDHPQHSTEVMGGMWGVTNNRLFDIRSKIINYYEKLSTGQSVDLGYGIDQNFLKEEFPKYINGDCCVHDEFFTKIPFPTNNRRDDYFVGRQFDVE